MHYKIDFTLQNRQQNKQNIRECEYVKIINNNIMKSEN